MKCYCCDRNLNDYESTLKHSNTGEYLDMCMTCLDGLEIPTTGRKDLNKREVPEDDWDGVILPDNDVEWDT